jgi:hypothetical protein
MARWTHAEDIVSGERSWNWYEIHQHFLCIISSKQSIKFKHIYFLRVLPMHITFFEWQKIHPYILYCTHNLQKKRYKLQQINMKGRIETSPAAGARNCVLEQKEVVGTVAGSRTSGAWSLEDNTGSTLGRQPIACPAWLPTSITRRGELLLSATLAHCHRELAHGAGFWSVAVGGRRGDGAEEDDRPEMGNK